MQQSRTTSKRWASFMQPSALLPSVCWYADAACSTRQQPLVQVENNPIPHMLIDIRSNEQWKQHPLPAELHAAVHIEAHTLGPALASDLTWRERLSAGTKHADVWPAHPPSPNRSPRGVLRPHPSTLLVLLTDDVTEGRTTAAAAAHKAR